MPILLLPCYIQVGLHGRHISLKELFRKSSWEFFKFSYRNALRSTVICWAGGSKEGIAVFL